MPSILLQLRTEKKRKITVLTVPPVSEKNTGKPRKTHGKISVLTVPIELSTTLNIIFPMLPSDDSPTTLSPYLNVHQNPDQFPSIKKQKIKTRLFPVAFTKNPSEINLVGIYLSLIHI